MSYEVAIHNNSQIKKTGSYDPVFYYDIFFEN
jgi:hypothetical protein